MSLCKFEAKAVGGQASHCESSFARRRLAFGGVRFHPLRNSRAESGNRPASQFYRMKPFERGYSTEAT